MSVIADMNSAPAARRTRGKSRRVIQLSWVAEEFPTNAAKVFPRWIRSIQHGTLRDGGWVGL